MHIFNIKLNTQIENAFISKFNPVSPPIAHQTSKEFVAC